VIDLDAPIIPGVGAGGIVLGSRIQRVLRETSDYFTSEPVTSNLGDRPAPDWLALYMPPSLFSIIYRSPTIDLWVKDGSVHQIGVHDDYRGKLLGWWVSARRWPS
jgi:hypothetical protein